MVRVWIVEDDVAFFVKLPASSIFFHVIELCVDLYRVSPVNDVSISINESLCAYIGFHGVVGGADKNTLVATG